MHCLVSFRSECSYCFTIFYRLLMADDTSGLCVYCRCRGAEISQVAWLLSHSSWTLSLLSGNCSIWAHFRLEEWHSSCPLIFFPLMVVGTYSLQNCLYQGTPETPVVCWKARYTSSVHCFSSLSCAVGCCSLFDSPQHQSPSAPPGIEPPFIMPQASLWTTETCLLDPQNF